MSTVKIVLDYDPDSKQVYGADSSYIGTLTCDPQLLSDLELGVVEKHRMDTMIRLAKLGYSADDLCKLANHEAL